MKQFLGYRRPNGSVGVRNMVALITAGRCANEMACRIADEAGSGVVPLIHNQPCVHVGPDNERAKLVLSGLGQNPNVAAAIVLGIGCDSISAVDLADAIATTGKPVEVLTIEREGDYDTVVTKGIRFAKQMKADASLLTREPFGLDEIRLAVKCGGSDTTSALGCNPVAGWAVDRIIDAGGTAVFSETAELIGAEHIVARRGATPEVSQKLLDAVSRMDKRIFEAGVDILGSEPTPGNIKGGLTSIEEKSLGAIAKSGTRPLTDVILWGDRLPGKGLYFLDGSANTPQMALGLAAAGAQMMTFGYGGGLPARFRGMPASSLGNLPILPVIKIVSSPHVKSELDYFDVYTGGIIEGTDTIADVGQRLLDTIVDVASGKPTKVELAPRYREVLEMWRVGPVF
jgi:altronate dehydratase large subunit